MQLFLSALYLFCVSCIMGSNASVEPQLFLKWCQLTFFFEVFWPSADLMSLPVF